MTEKNAPRGLIEDGRRNYYAATEVAVTRWHTRTGKALGNGEEKKNGIWYSEVRALAGFFFRED